MSSVHGGDFAIAGPKGSLDCFKEELQKKHDLKEGVPLGPHLKDDKEGRVLNRIIRWIDKGLTYEADPS